MKKTSDYAKWINSLEDGYFTLDGANISITNCYVMSMGIKSLKGFPDIVNKICNVGDNPLGRYDGLIGGPKIVRGDFLCILCQLTSLEGAPRRSHSIICSQNNIVSFQGIQHQIDYTTKIVIERNPLSENVLGLLLVQGLTQVDTWDSKYKHSEPPGSGLLGEIITQHLPGGKQAIYKCAQKLVEAGFTKAAKL